MKPEDDGIKERNTDDDGASQRSQQVSPTIVRGPNDVICGKGNRLNHHGNVRYRAECARLLPRYLEAPSSERKVEVALEIQEFVYRQGGRFLEDEGTPGVWRIASFETALKKTRQLLTDATKTEVDGINRDNSQLSDGNEDDQGDEPNRASLA